MLNIELSSIGKKIKGENYLSNCYRRLIRTKIIHFLFLLIEILLILTQEIDIFHREFEPKDHKEQKIIISPIILLVHKFGNFPGYINFIIIIFSILIFDSLYLFLCKNDIKKKNLFLSIIINFLELFYFRLYTLFFYSLLFSLPKLFFLISFAISIPHTYLIIHNFLCNHLYYYVPDFVDYPYDQFGSIYDLYFLISKIIISIASTADQIDLAKFCFIIVFVLQIFFFFYFIDTLINHSYLFMKNSFLNRTKLSLFLAETTIVFFSYFLGDKNLFTVLFLLISIGIIIIFIGFLYFIYDPYTHIHIENAKPMENMFYYLNMINGRNDIEFLIERKLNSHYKECGICNLCKKYIKYKTEVEREKDINQADSEKVLLIDYNKDNKKIIDLFDLLDDGIKKYFKFIRKVVTNYRKFGKSIFSNNVYYYINLSYLIYSDYINNDITLSLNEKIILEIVNQENQSFLENHQAQINQLILCNEFISLSKKTINLIKNILHDDQSFFKAKNLIELSELLNIMKKPKYKKSLFSHKLENATNSRNMLIACSLIYEEIFNTTINNSHMPIRDNIQPLEDIFNLNNRNNNIITLEVDLMDYNCKIIRAGKGLYSHINKNLYDLFPIHFKQYQMNIFWNSIFNGFNNEQDNFELNENKKKINNNLKKGKNRKEFIEIKIILSENIDERVYYKLLTLRMSPLFNNENNHFILFNGNYAFSKTTIISIIDLSHKNEIDEKILGVSDPSLENDSDPNLITIKKYISWQSSQGYKLTKLFSYKISTKLYNIYTLDVKKEGALKKKGASQKLFKLKSIEEDENTSEEIRKNKLKVYEETNSVSSSVQSSAYSRGISSVGIRKIKKENFIKYSGFSHIQKIIYLSIFIVIIIILVEYLYFNKLKHDAYNNNFSYINYRGFFRLYYQLFSSILGVACIPESIGSTTCRNFISIFNKVYSETYPENTFNFTELLLVQNDILAKKIVEEKANIIKINDYIGTERYEELFNSKIKHIQINQRVTRDGTVYTTKEMYINFFESILILCNSFGVLTENSTFVMNQPIYFLNKSINPFSSLFNQPYLTTYQEELYKMILNYKYYSKQFATIDGRLFYILNTKSFFIKIIIFLFVNLNTFLYLIIGTLIYIFLICFDKIIIRVLNYVLMTINSKTDGFDFNSSFSKKIDNLEIVLELYKSSPLEAIQNLNILYNDYNQYLMNKNKAGMVDSNKKGLNKRNTEVKKGMDDIPKDQQIISRKDIDKLKINNKYEYILFLMVSIILIIYCIFTYLWIDYFSKKTKLFNIVNKNARVENACYEAFNMYELMIFNNFTLEEMGVFLEYTNVNEGEKTNISEANSNLIFDSFYQDLYLLFDLEKDQHNIGTMYQDFEDLAEFNCYNMVVTFKYEILEKVDEILSEVDLKKKLVEICTVSHITESRNLKTIFERHFQFIKNGMLSLTDFSFEGLNKNLEKTTIGRIAFFFFTTTIYIIEVTTSKPHKDSITKLMSLLGERILITEIVFIIFGIALIVIILFFYIYNINKFCKQIFLLRKTFNIFEMHEQ